MEKAEITIEGMSCLHCVKAVKGALESLEGVKKAEVNLEEGKAFVEYDGAKVSVAKMKEEIQEQGYEIVN
ncbi:MAG: copper ion binding protein [Elusimicrobiota bacterium]|jgi:copper chaperone|nr:copper ion binding protein [Elusimicrobiota bacterium]